VKRNADSDEVGIAQTSNRGDALVADITGVPTLEDQLEAETIVP
jgi:hypothetical protein